MRRTTYLLGTLGAIAAVVAVGYFFRYRASLLTPLPGARNGTLPGGGAPSPTGGTPARTTPPPSPLQQLTSTSFGVISDVPTLDYFVQEQSVLVIQPDGQVLRIANDGTPTVQSSAIIANLMSASFSYDGAKLLVIFGDRSAPQSSIFDVAKKEWSPLPENIRSPAWSPGSYDIAYISGGKLAVRDAAHSAGFAKARESVITTLQFEDARLAWAGSGTILVGSPPSAFARSTLLSVDLKTGNAFPIADDRFGVQGIWDAGANRGLIFSGIKKGEVGTLSFVSGTGTAQGAPPFVTLPSKCVFGPSIKTLAVPAGSSTSTPAKSSPSPTPAANIVYCAVPQNLRPEYANPKIPDDYLRRAFYAVDALLAADPTSGSVTPITVVGAGAFDAWNLKIYRGKLFFVNRYDMKLYGLTLPRE